LVLTGEGEQLLGHCRGILGAFGSLTEQTELLRRPDAGVLKVAATPQTIDGVLSVFLARYAKRRPNVQIKLTEGGWGFADSDARTRRGSRRDQHGGSDSSQQLFVRDNLAAVAGVCCGLQSYSFSSRIAQRRTFAASLRTRSCSSIAASPCARRLTAACRVAEFKPNIAFESRTPHTLLALAEAGHGVAIVPSVMPTHRYDLQIVRLAYRGKPLREAYAIAWDKRRSLPPSADDFCQSLLAYVREVFPISRPSEARPDATVKRRAARRVREKRCPLTRVAMSVMGSRTAKGDVRLESALA
jgi:DNA-binding transcriptional LysR family regulator